MRPDLYTKLMLTIIAACLVWLSLGGPSRLPALQAQAEPTRVVLAGWVSYDRESSGQVVILRNVPGAGLPVTSR